MVQLRPICSSSASTLGRSFLAFVASTTLAGLAMQCVRFGVSWLAVQESGSAAVFAAMIGISSLVEVYSKPLLAPMADYFDRLKVFRVCVVLSAAAASGTLLVVSTISFSAPMLTAMLVAMSLIAGLRDPSAGALVPSLVKPSQMVQAQSLRASLNTATQLFGAMAGGLAVAAVGVSWTLALGGALMVLSVACTFLVRVLDGSNQTSAPKPWGVYLKTWHHRTADGLKAVWLVRSERMTAIATTIINAGIFPLTAVVLPVWAATTLGGSSAVVAVVELGFGVGVLVGATAVTRMSNAAMGRFNTMLLGIVLIGLGAMLASLSTSIAIIIACFLGSGIGVSMFMINSSTLRAAATPPSFRARMMGGVSFLSCCLYPLTSHGTGVVLDALGAPVAVALCGLVIVSAALVMGANRDARRMLAWSDDELAGRYGSMYPAAFAERPVVSGDQVGGNKCRTV